MCANLDTFAVVSEDDVRKLVMKSKTTSCALANQIGQRVYGGITATLHAHYQSLYYYWGIPTRVEDCTCSAAA